MIAAQGVLTSRGGATSHAAVVARGMGKPCVSGAESIIVNQDKRQFTANGKVVKEGDVISIDGATGEVFAGEIPVRAPSFAEMRDLDQILKWADEKRRLGVWANRLPRDALKAREYGAESIALPDRAHVYKPILADRPEDDSGCAGRRFINEIEKAKAELDVAPAEKNDSGANCRSEKEGASVIGDLSALDELLPIQKRRLQGHFQAMAGLPVIIGRRPSTPRVPADLETY